MAQKIKAKKAVWRTIQDYFCAAKLENYLCLNPFFRFRGPVEKCILRLWRRSVNANNDRVVTFIRLKGQLLLRLHLLRFHFLHLEKNLFENCAKIRRKMAKLKKNEIFAIFSNYKN